MTASTEANAEVERLRKFRDRLYSTWRSQEQDVAVNGARHPGLLEPMAGILKNRLAEFDSILAALAQADQPSAAAIPAGMVPWASDKRPDDIDTSEPVLFADGRTSVPDDYDHPPLWSLVIAYTPKPTTEAGSTVAAGEAPEQAINDLWRQYAADFDGMTDEEIERERRDAQALFDEQESWLEAVASWEAAGKPRAALDTPVQQHGGDQ